MQPQKFWASCEQLALPRSIVAVTAKASAAAAIVAGDRRALARSITLVESTRADHRERADALLEELCSHRGFAYRVGITGTPGVGKSTLIEAFGLHLCNQQGLRVAVLAVDPSSTRTGGSILGDKTRMSELARHSSAYIRPTPSGGTLGGVARRTREVMLLCDAAGFDVILVETVGVGQSETTVAGMTDAFVLLVAPGGGDELQGVKRGIMELADIIAVNKCDGSFEAQARSTLSDYSSALRLMRPTSASWTPEALPVSAVTGLGVAQLWDTLVSLRDARVNRGELADRRLAQDRAWFWEEVREQIIDRMRTDHRANQLLLDVEHGTRTPTQAAAELLKNF